jgi:hypothetical protein
VRHLRHRGGGAERQAEGQWSLEQEACRGVGCPGWLGRAVGVPPSCAAQLCRPAVPPPPTCRRRCPASMRSCRGRACRWLGPGSRSAHPGWAARPGCTRSSRRPARRLRAWHRSLLRAARARRPPAITCMVKVSVSSPPAQPPGDAATRAAPSFLRSCCLWVVAAPASSAALGGINRFRPWSLLEQGGRQGAASGQPSVSKLSCPGHPEMVIAMLL